MTKVSIYDSALRLLSFRPRSVEELRKRLLDKKYLKSEVEIVLSRLKKEKLLDDARFAKIWIRHRSIGSAKGRRFIFAELCQKGVDKDLIKKTLLEEYNEDKELELARELAKKKKLPKEKLIAFLSRRGFSWEIIREIIKNKNLVTS